MTSGKRYTEEFEREAVRQITERGHKLTDVAERLGLSVWSLSRWKRRYGEAPGEVPAVAESSDAAAEIARLRAESRRITEERDILKKATACFAKLPGLGTRSSRSSRSCTPCARCAG